MDVLEARNEETQSRGSVSVSSQDNYLQETVFGNEEMEQVCKGLYKRG